MLSLSLYGQHHRSVETKLVLPITAARRYHYATRGEPSLARFHIGKILRLASALEPATLPDSITLSSPRDHPLPNL